VVGLGGGGLPAFLARCCGLAVEAVELDPAVVDLARRHFGFRDDDTLRVRTRRPAILHAAQSCKQDRQILPATPLIDVPRALIEAIAAQPCTQGRCSLGLADVARSCSLRGLLAAAGACRRRAGRSGGGSGGCPQRRGAAVGRAGRGRQLRRRLPGRVLPAGQGTCSANR